jgi:hypothetical protein
MRESDPLLVPGFEQEAGKQARSNYKSPLGPSQILSEGWSAAIRAGADPAEAPARSPTAEMIQGDFILQVPPRLATEVAPQGRGSVETSTGVDYDASA